MSVGADRRSHALTTLWPGGPFVASSRGHRSNLVHFADADRRVAELKERISRQRAVIERAKQRGRPTGAAESIVRTLETSLRSFERHRERIFGRLERSGDNSR